MSLRDRWLATKVVARLLAVNESTVREWAKRSLADEPLPPRVASLAGAVERHPFTGHLRWDPEPVRALRAQIVGKNVVGPIRGR